VVFLGPPGTGKTHLAIGLAIRACQAGHRVAFATAAQWVDRLARHYGDGAGRVGGPGHGVDVGHGHPSQRLNRPAIPYATSVALHRTYAQRTFGRPEYYSH
jgi:IstB-like ATP binding protein